MKFLLVGEETPRIRFSQVDRNDFKKWVVFFQDPRTSLHWVEPEVTAETACEKWFDKQAHRYENNLGGMNSLIDKSTNQLIGYCGLLIQVVDGIQELEIGYSLLPKFWNHGFAIEAAKKCRDFAFGNGLADSLISIISVTNVPSERVAIKNGMRLSKTTVYKENQVNIFRITINQWRSLKS